MNFHLLQSGGSHRPIPLSRRCSSELGISAQALLSDTVLLQSVLAYHLIGQVQTQSSWVSGKANEPVGGGFFKLVTGNPVTITDGRNRLSRTTQTDVLLANGALHRIDRVLLPANRTIVETAQAIAQTSTLVTAIQAAGLVPLCRQQGRSPSLRRSTRPLMRFGRGWHHAQCFACRYRVAH